MRSRRPAITAAVVADPAEGHPGDRVEAIRDAEELAGPVGMDAGHLVHEQAARGRLDEEVRRAGKGGGGARLALCVSPTARLADVAGWLPPPAARPPLVCTRVAF